MQEGVLLYEVRKLLGHNNNRSNIFSLTAGEITSNGQQGKGRLELRHTIDHTQASCKEKKLDDVLKAEAEVKYFHLFVVSLTYTDDTKFGVGEFFWKKRPGVRYQRR
jgi:hypothetical protein